MGDLMEFDDDAATENEKFLKARLGDRRNEAVALSQEIATLRETLRQNATDTIAHDQAVDAKIDKLRVELLGDVEMKARWDKALSTGTYPNYPAGKFDGLEPLAPGAIEAAVAKLDAEIDDKIVAVTSALDAKIEGLRATFEKLAETLGTTRTGPAFTEQNRALLLRLEAFLGPAMTGTPPLDGSQIATKAYVDQAVERLSGAIRVLVGDAVEIAKDLKRRLGAFDPDRDNTATTTWSVIAGRIAWAYRRERERYDDERARAQTPGRLGSLLHALTGRPPAIGDHHQQQQGNGHGHGRGDAGGPP
jgi:hypothetical protein